jgi:prophage regulatory protein
LPVSSHNEQVEHLLSPDEVRQRLGISRTYTYRLLAQGTLPSLRLGRVRRIRACDLQTFIQDRLEGCDA